MRQLKILLVEDNEGDIILTTEALDEVQINKKLFVVKDGWEAVQYLEKTGKYKGFESPDIVFLDINIPKLNGHEVLKRIKSNELTSHIPVVILSSSTAEKDLLSSYENNASYYIHKPLETEDLLKAVSLVE